MHVFPSLLPASQRLVRDEPNSFHLGIRLGQHCRYRIVRIRMVVEIGPVLRTKRDRLRVGVLDLILGRVVVPIGDEIIGPVGYFRRKGELEDRRRVGRRRQRPEVN